MHPEAIKARMTIQHQCRTNDTSVIQEGRVVKIGGCVTLLRLVVRLWKEDDRTAQVYRDFHISTPS